MKKILIWGGIIGAIGYFAFKGTKKIIESFKNLSFFLTSVGKPRYENNMLIVPLQMGIDNPNSTDITAQKMKINLHAKVFTFDSNRAETLLGVVTPNLDFVAKAKIQSHFWIDTKFPALSLLTNIFALWNTKGIIVKIYPFVMGEDLPEISQKIDLNLRALLGK